MHKQNPKNSTKDASKMASKMHQKCLQNKNKRNSFLQNSAKTPQK